MLVPFKTRGNLFIFAVLRYLASQHSPLIYTKKNTEEKARTHTHTHIHTTKKTTRTQKKPTEHTTSHTHTHHTTQNNTVFSICFCSVAEAPPWYWPVVGAAVAI